MDFESFPLSKGKVREIVNTILFDHLKGIELPDKQVHFLYKLKIFVGVPEFYKICDSQPTYLHTKTG